MLAYQLDTGEAFVARGEDFFNMGNHLRGIDHRLEITLVIVQIGYIDQARVMIDEILRHHLIQFVVLTIVKDFRKSPGPGNSGVDENAE